ncbi:MAG: SLC13 family permease [Candidatus Marinimicrobia bacterium]|nr:SLC13 family permease [Candidatus Neomarinimicrobiota bacterium]MCH8300105.1 SLC13 family permease [Candidatus Neomarinimicrobiota bacterium]MCH8304138.1 SLC13 family permease [Candidatus Neomarinimicrobiota bacterium]TFB09959.1 SLC13 family permease [Candidatus Marinimicrobia bacterium MT.SAG.2]
MDNILLIGILLGTLILFISDRLSADLVALLALVALLLFKFITPEEAVSGFSNSATITIGAMFILSAGLIHTGLVDQLAVLAAEKIKNAQYGLMLFIIVIAGGVSAFINNTAVVAVFLPVIIKISRERGLSPSKFLIPLSFAAILGGSVTLIGSSTNILVSAIAKDHGLAEFKMFEFAPVGMTLFVAGGLFLWLFAYRILPERASTGELTKSYNMKRYLTEITVTESSPLIGKTLMEKKIAETYDVNILEIIRGEEKIWRKLRSTAIEKDDLLLVRGSVQNIVKFTAGENLQSLGDAVLGDEDLQAEDVILAEAVIAPNSTLIGYTVKEINFRQRFSAFVLAVQSHGTTFRDKIGRIPLHFGDSLLLQGSSKAIQNLQNNQDFLMLEEVKLEKYRTNKALLAIGIIALVVLFSALELLPIMVAAIFGAVLMVVTGCINIKEAYANIDWMVIFLLAGLIPMGIALQKSGLVRSAADNLLILFGDLSPVFILSALYIGTVLLTSILSNTATAIVVAPIGISMALSLGVNPKPFLMAIMFGASTSLITPIGYQTNTLVYSPGRYKFIDYLKVGLPLNIMAWLIVTLLIPIFWPFH